MNIPSMRLPIIIIAFITELFIVGCNSDSQKSNLEQEANKIDTVKSSQSIAPIDTLKAKEETFDKTPSSLLLSMTQYLDSLGFGCDAKFNCQKKIAEPCMCEISLKNHPMEDTVYKYKLGYDHVDPKTIKRDLLRKALVIYAFPYSVKNKGKDINADGIIEEWVYQNEALAEEAGLEWNRIRNFIFHHTASYVCRKSNRLYIFHNRAAFDKIHRETILRFKGQFDKEYPATIPNANH